MTKGQLNLAQSTEPKNYGKTENNKNSSGDEIADVNFFTTISHTYFKTPKREPISFNKLDDS